MSRLESDGRLTDPVLQSTGTGGGFDLFCAGVGDAHPDVTGASRPIQREEWEECQDNGVGPISEVLIGFDGLTIAYAKEAPVEWQLTPRQLYLALAAEVPVDGALAANPHRSWSDVDPALPDVEIRVMGPPPSSGTRDSFEELALEAGCAGLEAIEALDASARAAACTTIRTDGPFIEASEDDEAIVTALREDETLLGVFGFSYLYANDGYLRGAAVNGVTPSFVTIATGEYAFSRPLFLYVKNDHRKAVPAISDFLSEYVRNAMVPFGYLVEMGLTPILDDTQREQIAGEAMDGTEMNAPPSF